MKMVRMVKRVKMVSDVLCHVCVCVCVFVQWCVCVRVSMRASMHVHVVCVQYLYCTTMYLFSAAPCLQMRTLL